MPTRPSRSRRRSAWRWVSTIASAVVALGILGPSTSAAPADSTNARTDPTASEMGTREHAGGDRADALGRATPRGALAGFLDACRRDDFQRAARYLDFEGLPQSGSPDEAARIAHRLHSVLEKMLWPDPAALSGAPEGNPTDDPSPDMERLGRIATRSGDVEILLRRAEIEGAGLVWLFAPATVSKIPRLYAEYGYGWLGDTLPAHFFRVQFLGLALWQWCGLALGVLAAVGVGFLVTALVVGIARRIARRTRVTWDDVLLDKIRGPFRLAVTTLAFYFASETLSLDLGAQHFLAAFCKVGGVVSVTWILLRVVDIAAAALLDTLRVKDAAVANTLLPMGRRALKIFVLTIALVSLLQNIGFNITGLVAGLGVGGLAIALAAQKTLENLFGGIAVLADRPVKVGDTCAVGQHAGVVEDIGIRSTRIRMLDRTLVSIPNAEFSTARIENQTARDFMRIRATIQVAYDTSPDQLRFLLVELRNLLAAHPKTIPDMRRVRFVQLGASSLDVELFVGIATQDVEEFLAIREGILLRVMDLVRESGAHFAFPSQTVYLDRGRGRDPERSRRAEEAVAAWRREGRLDMLDLPADDVANPQEGDDSPPGGSPARRPR